MQGIFKGSRGRAANAAQPLGRFIDDPFMLRDSVPCAGHAEHSFWAHERRAAWVRFYRLSAWSHQSTLNQPRRMYVAGANLVRLGRYTVAQRPWCRSLVSGFFAQIGDCSFGFE